MCGYVGLVFVCHSRYRFVGSSVRRSVGPSVFQSVYRYVHARMYGLAIRAVDREKWISRMDVCEDMYIESQPPQEGSDIAPGTTACLKEIKRDSPVHSLARNIHTQFAIFRILTRLAVTGQRPPATSRIDSDLN